MLGPVIVNYIKLYAREELNGKDENFLNLTWDSLTAAFQGWKLEHGDRDVKYKTPLYGLHDVRNENKINFDEAAPWECAGLEFPSPIGLAFKLQEEKYPAYLEIAKNVGLATIFALLITGDTKQCSDYDLFFAYALIAERRKDRSVLTMIRKMQEVQKPLVTAGEKQLENLAKGRVAAGKRKSERANEYRETWRKWAQEAWENGHSWWTAEDVLDSVCSLAEKHGHKMANGKPYAKKTIRLAITGVKKVVRTQH